MTRLIVAALLAGIATPAFAQVAKPAALTADGLPAVPDALAAASRPYMESRGAGFAGWNARDRSMLVSTRFGNVNQLHSVAMPMGMRRQISFEAEPIGGRWSPTGDVLVTSKDNGGDEFFQIYTLKDGRLSLLTAGGKSRNGLGPFSKDGSLIGFSSTERNGTDSDLYVMNPRDPATKRRVAEVQGGGWAIVDFAPGNGRALVIQYISVTKSNLNLLDLATNKLTPLGDHAKDVSYGGAEFAPDGTLWVTSDEGSDFQRLGTVDLTTGKFTPRGPATKWDVDSFTISDDGRTIAMITNEAGIDRLSLIDVASGTARRVDSIPAGGIGGLEFAPWGTLGFSLTSAKSATDAYSLDPATLVLTRWTASETGGLDPSVNVEPELITVKSFDGLEVSGFLYRPNPAKFPGKRPLIVNIHGGPEGQSTPGFMGRNNYLLNEQGIAIFYPNVRGSTGYGKKFVSLDNGPFLRENSVKDIGPSSPA